MEPSQKPGTVVGPYTITRLIGAGGMGEVYLASETKLNRRVALKIIIPGREGEGDALKRFQLEGRALASISHKNVVAVYAVDQIETFNYIAMEFCEGRSLNDLCQNIVWPAAEAAPLFMQILEGVQALHDKNIVHRDLKPHNIIFEKSSVIKIIDLGIAKVFNDTQNTSHTSTGMMVGTLQYMAPEVVRGGTATALADIWSMGAIFYQMLMGMPLIKGSNHVEYFASHANMRVAFPPAIAPYIPPEMQLIVAKMCSKETGSRYKSVAEVAADLKAFEAKYPNKNLWIYSNYARDISNIAAVKSRLLQGGRSEFTAKQVIFQALLENNFTKLAEADPDKTVDFKQAVNEEISDAALTSAISKVTTVMPLKQAVTKKQKDNRITIAGAVAAAVFLTGGFWYWKTESEKSAKLEAARMAAQAAPAIPVAKKVEVAAVPEIERATETVRAGDTPEALAQKAAAEAAAKAKRSSDDELAEQILAESKKAKPLAAEPVPERPRPRAVEIKDPPPASPNLNHPELKIVLQAKAAADGRAPSAQVLLQNPPVLDWKPIPRTREYNLQIAGDRGFDKPILSETLTANEYKWAAAKPGRYTWRVQSVNHKGDESEFSEIGELDLSVPPVQLPPVSFNETAVINPAALEATPSMIPVRWQGSPLASAYEVSVSSDASFSSTDMTTNVKANETKIAFTAAGTKYVRVTAVDAKGRSISSASNPMKIELKTVQTIAPPSPVAPPSKAKLMLKGKPGPLLLNWTKIDKAETYELQLSDREDFSNVVFSKSQKANQMVLKQVLPEGSIYWRIRANTPSAQSPWSPTGIFEIK